MMADFLNASSGALFSTFAFFLATYLIHSTLMLGGVLLAVRFRLIKSHVLKDILLKTALVGSFATAAFQFGFGTSSLLGKWEFSLPEEASRDELALVVQIEGEAERLLNVKKQPLGAIPGLLGDDAQIIWVEVDSVDTKMSTTVSPPNFEKTKLSGSERSNANGGGLPFLLIGIALAGWLGIFLALFFRHARRRRQFRGRMLERREIVSGPLPRFLVELCDTHGIYGNIRLTSSGRISSPIALGMGEICIPEQAFAKLTLAQQKSMLAHEIAHVARRDPIWLKIYAFFEIALFFQPLNRIARRELQETAEFLCDDWAVRATGESLDLAKCLAEVASWLKTQPFALPVAGMAELRSPLIRRVQRLLDNTSRHARDLPRLARSALAFGLVFIGLGFAPSITQTQLAPSIQEQTKHLRKSTQIDTGDDVSYKIRIDWEEISDERVLKYKARGTFVFGEDDREILKISSGGYLKMEEKRGGVQRRIEVRRGKGKKVSYKFFVNDLRTEFDDAAQKWYEAMLIEFIREANVYGAHVRAKRIFERRGIDALRREIELIRQEDLKKSYRREFEKLIGGEDEN